jgi:catechol 2,3-dioxygenase-like lactoylglutathione lyase family enzyme
MQIVSRIGHVGLRVPDLDEAVEFAEGVLGLRETQRREGVSYLTCNHRHHEHMLIEGEAKGCDHLALEAPNVDAVEEARDRLIAAGVHILSESVDEQGIDEAIRFVGPGEEVFELFAGMTCDQPHAYETPACRPRKFGHITLKVEDPEATAEFLTEILGFRLSDRMQDLFFWLRCNSDHHGLGLIKGTAGLHHYALEVDDWASLKHAGDHLIARGRTFAWGPGRHGPGNNLFSYLLDQDGTVCELFADIYQVEDEASYRPRDWPEAPTTVNQWGPPPPDGFLDLVTPHAPAKAVSA